MSTTMNGAVERSPRNGRKPVRNGGVKNGPILRGKGIKHFYAEFGQFIRTRRIEVGLSQAQVAALLRVSQQTIFAYETGERRFPLFRLADLAQALRTTVDHLLGRKLEHPWPPKTSRQLSPASVRLAEELQGLPHSKRFFVAKIVDLLGSER